MICLIIGIGGYFAIYYSVRSIDISAFPKATRSLIYFYPTFFAIAVIYGIIKGLGKDSNHEIINSEYRVGDKIDWIRYGERLKLAYAAKFGGDNLGFNQEVDYHIKILVNTDKGYTRQLAKDWVKRMSAFVEIKYLKMENSNEVA